jgi:hypothetical protein
MKVFAILISLIFITQENFAGQCSNPAPVTKYPCSHCVSTLPYPNKEVEINILEFGAIPNDGISDQCAFEAASDYIQNNSIGAGNVILNIPRGVYNVGEQELNCRIYLFGKPVIQLRNCSNVKIVGEPGAILNYESCLKYGSFNPGTGDKYMPYPPARRNGKVGFNDWNYAAYPNNCIDLTNCEMITISGLELDGNINKAIIGGSFAEDFANIQLPFDGIYLNDCRKINLSDVNVHDFGRDGIMINGSITSEKVDLKMDNCSFNRNCRNGLSWGSGDGIVATSCNFNENGQTIISNPMRAGIDIEWEFGCAPANGHFINCNIQHNKAYGIVAGQNSWSVNNFTFEKCNITASEDHFNWTQRVASSHAVRGEARDMNFIGGTICGSIGRVYTGTSGGVNDEAQFTDVVFRPWDENGQLVTDTNGCILPFEISENATFDHCTFYRSNNISFMEIPMSKKVGFYDCKFYDFSKINWNGTLNSFTSIVQNNNLYTRPNRKWLTNDTAILHPPCFTVSFTSDTAMNFPLYTNPTQTPIHLFCFACSANDPVPYELENGECQSRLALSADGEQISNHHKSEDFSIYPNPSHDNIHINGFAKNSTLVITDILYKTVLKVENTEYVDISSLKNGIYFIRVNEKQNRVFVKN